MLLTPSQAFMKHTLEEHPQITNDGLGCEVEKAAEVYARYYVDCNLQDPAPDEPSRRPQATGVMEDRCDEV